VAKQVWLRSATPVFRDGGSVISSTQIDSIDYLFGQVALSTAPGGAVTASGTYVPVASLAGCHTYTLNHVGGLLDHTVFETSGWRQHLQGLKDVTMTISRWDNLYLNFFETLQTGVAVLMETRPGGGVLSARGWFVGESESHSGDVNSLEETEINLSLNGTIQAAFRWSDQF
jgi:hypothetical protein